MITSARSVEDVVEVVRGTGPGVQLLPVGAASKPSLSTATGSDIERLDLSGLSGVLEYDPAELTITALAGTPVSDVQAALTEHGQYLPFDPPLAAAGATLGGTVAAGASGPNALRYGGVRDFVIGVQLVDGTGRLVSGGGKVVKNAAGFDLPKLLTGSIGRLGVITRLSFKVFPQPTATTTLTFAPAGLEQALATVVALKRGPVELDALDIAADGAVLARVGGREQTLEARAERLMRTVPGGATVPRGRDESTLWTEASGLTWRRPGSAVIRVGLSIRTVPALHTAVLASAPDARIRYSLGAGVAWIDWPADVALERLDTVLRELRLPGMLLFGSGPPRLGPPTGGAFAARVKHALDPDHRFLEL